MAIRKSKNLGPYALVALVVFVLLALWVTAPAEQEPVTTDLTGVWTITNKVETTNLERYRDDVHEFEIYVTQKGDALHGEGEQTRYNGKAARNHYRIWITEGTVRGDNVMIRYRMEGGRNTTGMFELAKDPDKSNELTGTFASSAAGTKGTTKVRVVSNIKD